MTVTRSLLSRAPAAVQPRLTRAAQRSAECLLSGDFLNAQRLLEHTAFLLLLHTSGRPLDDLAQAVAELLPRMGMAAVPCTFTWEGQRADFDVSRELLLRGGRADFPLEDGWLDAQTPQQHLSLLLGGANWNADLRAIMEAKRARGELHVPDVTLTLCSPQGLNPYLPRYLHHDGTQLTVAYPDGPRTVDLRPSPDTERPEVTTGDLGGQPHLQIRFEQTRLLWLTAGDVPALAQCLSALA